MSLTILLATRSVQRISTLMRQNRYSVTPTTPPTFISANVYNTPIHLPFIICSIITIHVVILGGSIIFILATCGITRTYWVLILGPLLVLYTAMTGLQPSAMRACIMGIV